LISERFSGQSIILITITIGFLFLFFIDALLGSNLRSFMLTFSILGLMVIFLILISFKKSEVIFSWTIPKPSKSHWEGLIERKILTLEGASNHCTYSQEEIAKILRNSLEHKQGYNSNLPARKFIDRAKLSDELIKKLGKNKKLLNIFMPKEDEHRKNLFFRMLSGNKENYLVSLEEAIRIIKE